MSLLKINPRFLHTTCSIQRRTVTKNDFGDTAESWANIATNIPITIQPTEVEEQTKLEQGKQFKNFYKAYLPIDLVIIKDNDRIVSEGVTYIIFELKEMQIARVGITGTHHYKLRLKVEDAPKA